ncbi:hypothetical protein N7G274_001312 [Stereocaulon virgatum]|uniref:Uncharacterized protein n=1 Tax=Stereocaulon virgatum TaxID=373712 RepID=A0ABR4ANH6_9LECA
MSIDWSPELIPPLSLQPLPTNAFTTPLRIYAVRTLFWDSIAAETTDYGCYTILKLANRRAGELWLDDAKGCLPEQSVKKDEMGMHLRRNLEVLEREGECFDRDLSGGKGGRKRFWVVRLEVGGPRN